MIKAVLFDADGTLFDSEQIRYRATKIAVQELLKIEFLGWDKYVKEFVNGSKTLKEILKLDDSSLDALRNRRAELIQNFVKTDLKFMDGALNLVMDLYAHNFKLGIVTSSRKDELNSYLNALNISPYFQALVTAGDVLKVKPDAEPFSKAAQLLSASPDECIVIEDTEKGLTAAKNAGIRCIIVPNRYTYNSDFSRADLILSSLKELDSQKLNIIFQ